MMMRMRRRRIGEGPRWKMARMLSGCDVKLKGNLADPLGY